MVQLTLSNISFILAVLKIRIQIRMDQELLPGPGIIVPGPAKKDRADVYIKILFLILGL